MNLNQRLLLMNQNQLIELITKLVDAHPSLGDLITKYLPSPTLQMAHSAIASAESAFTSSFPYSKSGISLTPYSYNRVLPHLSSLRDVILHYLHYFTNVSAFDASRQHEYPAEAFGYLDLATSTAHRLPHWPGEGQNQLNEEIYDALGKRWREWIKEVARRGRDEGKMYGGDVVKEWGRALERHCQTCKGTWGLGEALEEFKR